MNDELPFMEQLAARCVPGLDMADDHNRSIAFAGLMAVELGLLELASLGVYQVLIPSATGLLVTMPWLHGLALASARRGHLSLTMHLNCAVMWLFFVTIAAHMGGGGSMGMMLLITLPFVPLSLLRLRQGAQWSVIVTLTVAASYHPHLRELFSTPAIRPGYETLTQLWIGGSIFLATGGVVAQVTHITTTYTLRLRGLLEELDVARKHAEAVNASKDTFLASMSHELRTPMNGVVGIAGLLRESNLDADQTALVDTLKQSATALLDVVDEVLDFSRIESGRLTIEPRPTATRQLVQQVMGVAAVAADDKTLDLRHTIGDDVPEWVLLDAGRFRQVLYNLVGNAVKFTEEGYVSVRMVSLPTEPGRHRLRVTIEDSGPGIPPDILPTIFDRFVRVETAGMGQPGTGLGLAIARGLVEAMGGRLAVASELGTGTVFTAVLDVEVAEEPRQDLAEEAALEQATFHARVLVAEDNPINQRVARAMLERMGCTVTLADNGQTALDHVRRNPYDLVLMDYEMPQMDGLEASRRIRQLPGARASVPIIALTAHVLPESRQHCANAGMDDFMSKPMTMIGLRRAVARWCPHTLRRGALEASL